MNIARMKNDQLKKVQDEENPVISRSPLGGGTVQHMDGLLEYHTLYRTL